MHNGTASEYAVEQPPVLTTRACTTSHPLSKSQSLLYLLYGIATTLVLAACAVQNTPGSRNTQISFDQAAVFGTLIEEFMLPDGTEASIRRMNDQYSVKMQRQFKVIELGNPTNVRFKSAQTVDGYTLIVLEKVERNCPAKTQLLALRGSEVRSWEIGNCRTWPETKIYANAATFDIDEVRGKTRYQFSDGRLTYGEPPPQPAAPAHANQQEKANGKTANNSTQKQATAPSSGSRTGTNNTPSLPSAAPIFKPKEQAPRTIYLDK